MYGRQSFTHKKKINLIDKINPELHNLNYIITKPKKVNGWCFSVFCLSSIETRPYFFQKRERFSNS